MEWRNLPVSIFLKRATFSQAARPASILRMITTVLPPLHFPHSASSRPPTMKCGPHWNIVPRQFQKSKAGETSTSAPSAFHVYVKLLNARSTPPRGGAPCPGLAQRRESLNQMRFCCMVRLRRRSSQHADTYTYFHGDSSSLIEPLRLSRR